MGHYSRSDVERYARRAGEPKPKYYPVQGMPSIWREAAEIPLTIREESAARLQIKEG